MKRQRFPRPTDLASYRSLGWIALVTMTVMMNIVLIETFVLSSPRLPVLQGGGQRQHCWSRHDELSLSSLMPYPSQPLLLLYQFPPTSFSRHDDECKKPSSSDSSEDLKSTLPTSRGLLPSCKGVISRAQLIRQGVLLTGSSGALIAHPSACVGVVTEELALKSSSSTPAAAAAASIATTVNEYTDSSNASSSLSRRVMDRTNFSPPSYGLEGNDIFYPSWFIGTWEVVSTCTHILAPCGLLLFAKDNVPRLMQSIPLNATNENVSMADIYAQMNKVSETYFQATIQSQIGPLHALHYISRFVPHTSASRETVQSRDYVGIADREYNVRSLAQAAMGDNAIANIDFAGPNRFESVLLLAPKNNSSTLQESSLVRVELFTLRRRQESVSENEFHCSEYVRQIVTPINGNSKDRSSTSPLVVNEIETTSLYRFDPLSVIIYCTQRSATYLVPSRTNVYQMQLYTASQGRPIDVRYYDVTFSPRRRSTLKTSTAYHKQKLSL
jgi:hypothetical protein